MTKFFQSLADEETFEEMVQRHAGSWEQQPTASAATTAEDDDITDSKVIKSFRLNSKVFHPIPLLLQFWLKNP